MYFTSHLNDILKETNKTQRLEIISTNMQTLLIQKVD